MWNLSLAKFNISDSYVHRFAEPVACHRVNPLSGETTAVQRKQAFG